MAFSCLYISMFLISPSIVLLSHGSVKKAQTFCGLDERGRAANISVCVFDSWTDMSGLDPSLRSQGWAQNPDKEKRKVAEHEERKRGSSCTNPLCFSFLSRFFLFLKKTPFFGRSPSLFLTAAMCLISYVICSRRRLDAAAAAIFTLQQRLAKRTQFGANDQCEKKQKKLDMAEVKEEFLNVETISLCVCFPGTWTHVYWSTPVMICCISGKNH